MIPIQQVVEKISCEYIHILEDNLVGIYLHGSYAMGCFNPDRSDLDFIVVVNDPPDFATMRKLVSVLLDLSDDGPAKGFEMSVLLASDAKRIRYPTPFILHFSNYHKARYLEQPDYICGGFEDADLAAHLMVLEKRGICQYGKPISEAFQPVPTEYYVESIVNDVSSAADCILNDPTYYVLNLCRVLYYLMEGFVSSKKEVGEWAIPVVSPEFPDVVAAALHTYSNSGVSPDVNAQRLYCFIVFMKRKIQTCLDRSPPKNPARQ